MVDNLTRKQRIHRYLQIIRAVCLWYSQTHLERQPCRTSALSGEAWTREILNSRPTRFVEICRMDKRAFSILLTKLTENGTLSVGPSRVSREQSLMIFLYIVGQNVSNRNVQERFQHSGETISRHFNTVLSGLLLLQNDYIRLPNTNICPPEISNSSKFFPYFQNCIGAIDGTHLPLSVPDELSIRFRNRKGYTSQNVLAACSFDMSFLYVLAGWEGSVHDGEVLRNALRSDFIIPQGKYYLADAGYCLTPSFIVPYRGVRYHLKEWGYANQR